MQFVDGREKNLLLGQADGRLALFTAKGSGEKQQSGMLGSVDSDVRPASGEVTFKYNRSFSKNTRSVLSVSDVLATEAGGRFVAVGYSSGEAALHNINTQQPDHVVRTGFRPATNVALLPPESKKARFPLMLITSSAGFLSFYDPASLILLSNMRQSGGIIRDLCLLGPRTFVTCGSDGALRVWSVIDRSLIGLRGTGLPHPNLILQAESLVEDAHGPRESETEGSGGDIAAVCVVPTTSEFMAALPSRRLRDMSLKANAASNIGLDLDCSRHVLATVGYKDRVVKLWRPVYQNYVAKEDSDGGVLEQTTVFEDGTESKRLTTPPLMRLRYEPLLSFSYPQSSSQSAAAWSMRCVASRFLVIAQVGLADLVCVDLFESMKKRQPKIDVLRGHDGSVYAVLPSKKTSPPTFYSCAADQTVRRWELK
jgi:WD40 repeat protein